MIVRICELKIVACYARAETFTEALICFGWLNGSYPPGWSLLHGKGSSICLQWKTGVSLCPLLLYAYGVVNFQVINSHTCTLGHYSLIFSFSSRFSVGQNTAHPSQKHKIELEALRASLPKKSNALCKIQ